MTSIEIYHLEYIDIVVQDKMLFLITWHFKKAYRLSLPQLKTSFRKKAGAFVLKIPDSVQTLDIRISNLWTKKKFRVGLKKHILDNVSAKQLIRQLNPFLMPDFLLREPSVLVVEPRPFIGAPRLKSCEIQPHCITGTPLNTKLKYE